MCVCVRENDEYVCLCVDLTLPLKLLLIYRLRVTDPNSTLNKLHNKKKDAETEGAVFCKKVLGSVEKMDEERFPKKTLRVNVTWNRVRDKPNLKGKKF